MDARILSDEQMRSFLLNGYLVVKPDLAPDFHQGIFRQTEAVWETEFNPGNNLLARIPAVQKVFHDPTVIGALMGVLGPDYYMHPHRHCHYNAPGSPGQTLHKDGFSRRRHHPRWVLVFYYPQDTTEDMGPTSVLPGSPYYNTRPDVGEEDEVSLVVEAGSVAIVHYDIWHRGTPNRSNKNRYMMKFMFTRMEEPTAPSWDSRTTQWQAGDDEGHLDMYAHLWAWHRGDADTVGTGGNGSDEESITGLIRSLCDEPEPGCIDSAYKLGDIGTAAVAPLIEALKANRGEAGEAPSVSYGKLPQTNEADGTRRNISYALTAIGGPAVPALTAELGNREWWVRASAAETLGDIGLPAGDAVPALVEAVRDGSMPVRRAAAEALGTTGQSSASAVPGLAEALGGEDEVLRRNAALALCRIGRYAEDAVPALSRALEDADRYVRGKAAHALYRIGTPAAQDVLVPFLMTSRWCSLTTKDSLY